MATAATSIQIDDARIASALAAGRRHDAARVRSLLERARALGGLDDAEIATLTGLLQRIQSRQRARAHED